MTATLAKESGQCQRLQDEFPGSPCGEVRAAKGVTALLCSNIIPVFHRNGNRTAALAKAYSLELRERVLEAVAAGLSLAEPARKPPHFSQTGSFRPATNALWATSSSGVGA